MKTEQKKIIVVDDNNTNLTACKSILKPYYMVYPASSAAKMFGLMEHLIPDLILMDVDMPEMNGYEAAGRLKKNEAFKDIPFIFLSGRIDPASEMFGLNMGALDYIHKPFVSELLIRRIKTHLSLKEHNESIEEIFEQFKEISDPLISLIDILKTAGSADDSAVIKNSITKAIEISNGVLENVSNIFNNTKSGI